MSTPNLSTDGNGNLVLNIELGGEELERQFPVGTQLGDVVQSLSSMTRSVRGKLVIRVNGVETTDMNRPVQDGDRVAASAASHDLG